MDTYIVESHGFGNVAVDTIIADSVLEARRQAQKKHSISINAVTKEEALRGIEHLDFEYSLRSFCTWEPYV